MQHVARTAITVLGLAAALGLAACGGSAVPTVPPGTAAPVTAPPASAPPLPSVVDPTPVGGGPEVPAVVIVARNIDFEPKAVTVPANVPLTLVLDNQDTGVPHDIQVSDANGNVIVKTEIVNGPRQLPVALPALAPGVYPFICVVHPNMTGTITAE